jgi:hypothetical protein
VSKGCALELMASSTSCWKVNLVVQDLAHYLELCRESVGPYGVVWVSEVNALDYVAYSTTS